MADLAQLEAALIKADAAGNVDDARVFASEIRRLRETPQATPRPEVEPPNWVERQLAKLPDIPGASRGGPIDTFVRGMADPSIPANYVGERVVDTSQAMGASPDTAAGFGTAANVAVQAAPMALGSIARTAAPLLRSTAEHVMQSALKPILKYRQNGSADRAVATLLDEGINVSRGGVDKLRMMIDRLQGNVDNAINSSTATIPKGATGARLQDLVRDIERSNPTPDSALNSVNRVYDDFLTNPRIPDNIPVRQAQDFKTGLHRELAERYGQQGVDASDTAARKALARGLKEEIETAVPAVIVPNAEQSALRNAHKLVERRALLEGNNNVTGLAPLAPNPAALATFLMDKFGLTKSVVARLLNSGQEAIPAGLAELGIGTNAVIQAEEQRRRQMAAQLQGAN